MDIASLTTLAALAVTAAGTLTGTPITDWEGVAGLSGHIRFAGTGGLTVDAYLQTLVDGDATWADLYCAHFTGAGVSLFSLAQGAGANLSLTDGALAANTALNSGIVPLFDQYRLKVVSTGTWVNGLVSAYIMPR